MRTRIRIPNLDRTAENDIRYRGPLSYRHLLIMGWIGIVFTIIKIWTSIGISRIVLLPEWVFRLNDIAGFLGDFSVPLLLLTNYCIILDEKNTYKQLLIKYTALTLVVVALYMLLFGRYLSGIMNLFIEDSKTTNTILSDFIREGTRTGGLVFNLFIDLLLCTLFMFFLNYVPKNGFFSKHVLAFRYLALLPVLYELGSLAVRMLSARGVLTPSFYVYPLLTTKAPMSFVMFMALALYIKVREYRFLKKGKTLNQYKDFLKTNANSLQFSIYASIILIVTCLIDLLLLLLFVTTISVSSISRILPVTSTVVRTVTEETSFEDTSQGYALIDDEDLSDNENPDEVMPDDESTVADTEEDTEADRLIKTTDAVIKDAGDMTYAWGFGKHIQLIVLLPFLLLLSYTRVYKEQKIDALIPRAGVVLSILVFFEGMYQFILLSVPSFLNSIM